MRKLLRCWMALTDYNVPDQECLLKSLAFWIIVASGLISYHKEFSISYGLFCKIMLGVILLSTSRHLYRCNKWLHMKPDARLRNFIKYYSLRFHINNIEGTGCVHRSQGKGRRHMSNKTGLLRISLLCEDEGIRAVIGDNTLHIYPYEMGYRKLEKQFLRLFKKKKPLDKSPTLP